jgi:S1/P1 Nuclease
MHMPMHVGDNHDRGASDTQIRWVDRGTNAHSLGDSGIIDRIHKNEAAWLIDLGELDNQANRAKARSRQRRGLDHGELAGGSIGAQVLIGIVLLLVEIIRREVLGKYFMPFLDLIREKCGRNFGI